MNLHLVIGRRGSGKTTFLNNVLDNPAVHYQSTEIDPILPTLSVDNTPVVVFDDCHLSSTTIAQMKAQFDDVDITIYIAVQYLGQINERLSAALDIVEMVVGFEPNAEQRTIREKFIEIVNMQRARAGLAPVLITAALQ